VSPELVARSKFFKFYIFEKELVDVIIFTVLCRRDIRGISLIPYVTVYVFNFLYLIYGDCFVSVADQIRGEIFCPLE